MAFRFLVAGLLLVCGCRNGILSTFGVAEQSAFVICWPEAESAVPGPRHVGQAPFRNRSNSRMTLEFEFDDVLEAGDSVLVLKPGETVSTAIRALQYFEGVRFLRYTVRSDAGEVVEQGEIFVANDCPPGPPPPPPPATATINCDGASSVSRIPPGTGIPGTHLFAGEDCGWGVLDADTLAITNADSLDGTPTYETCVFMDPASGTVDVWATGPTGGRRRRWDPATQRFQTIQIIAPNSNLTGLHCWADNSGGLVTDHTNGHVGTVRFNPATGFWEQTTVVTPAHNFDAPGHAVDAASDGPGEPVYFVTSGPPGTPGDLRVWDPSTPCLTSKLTDVGDTPVAIGKVGQLVFVLIQGSGTLMVFDLATGTLTTHAVGATPVFMYTENDDWDHDGLVDVVVTAKDDGRILHYEFDAGDGEVTETDSWDVEGVPTFALPLPTTAYLVCLNEAGRIERMTR